MWQGHLFSSSKKGGPGEKKIPRPPFPGWARFFFEMGQKVLEISPGPQICPFKKTNLGLLLKILKLTARDVPPLGPLKHVNLPKNPLLNWGKEA